MTENTIGENLKRLRKEKGLSQRALAQLSGVTHSQIANYETGKAKPSLDTLRKLGKGLQLSIFEMVPYEEYKEEVLHDLPEKNDAFKKAFDFIEQEAKKRGINKIVKEIENLGYDVLYSKMQNEFLPSCVCEIYLSSDEFILVKDEDLIRLEEEKEHYLNFLFEKLVEKSEVHKEEYVNLSERNSNKNS